MNTVKFARVLLSFKTGYQLSQLGSHFLTRALLRAASHLLSQKELEELKTRNFATTDLFPWSKGETKTKEVYFKPVPLLPFFQVSKERKTQYQLIKQLKKAKFISDSAMSIYTQSINEQSFNETELRIRNGFITKMDEEVKLQTANYERPHNQMNRFNTITPENPKGGLSKQLYFTQEHWVRKGGLYFDVLTDSQDTLKIILAALRLLEDKGLGKRITIGLGDFEIHSISTSIKEPVTPTHQGQICSNTFLLLSHWIPSKNDIANNIIPQYYRLSIYKPTSTILPGTASKIALITKQYPLGETRLITSGSIIKNVPEGTMIIGETHEIGDERNPSTVWGKAIIEPIRASTK